MILRLKKVRLKSPPTLPMRTDSSICRVMCGSGFPTGFRRLITANLQKKILSDLPGGVSGYSGEVAGILVPDAQRSTEEMLFQNTGSISQEDSAVSGTNNGPIHNQGCPFVKTKSTKTQDNMADIPVVEPGT